MLERRLIVEINRIIMPYIGGVLSVNRYKIRGRGGHPTNKTKPEVEIWMTQLADKVKGLGFGSDTVIELKGHFSDDRVPDLHNLHKVIGDAIKEGLGVDDKDFRFVDIGYSTGYSKPELEITLKGGLD